MGKCEPIRGWYVREWRTANGTCWKIKYYVSPEKCPEYVRKDRKRAIRWAEKNITEAKHNAARTVNHNFRAGIDRFLTLTLSDEGLARLEKKAGAAQAEDADAVLEVMRHELELLIRRTHTRCAKSGTVLKYFAVASDQDGKTGELVRPHLHIIVNGPAADSMASAWKLGEVKSNKKLYSAHHGDLTDLVEYMISQARQIGNKKRYVPSRNLEQPTPTAPRRVTNVDAPLRVPKGCKFIWRSEQRAGRAQVLRYHRPPSGETIPPDMEPKEDRHNE